MRCLLLLLTAALVSPALAGPLEPPDLEDYLRWGPLRVRPGFRLANFGYDDNIYSSNSESETVGDTTATLVPSVEGLVLFGDRAFLKFKESLSYTSYANNSDQNYVDQLGTGRLTFPFERFGVFTDFDVNRVRTRPTDREDARPKRSEDRIGLGLIFELGWKTEFEIRQSVVNLGYTDDDGQNIGLQLDRDEDVREIAIRYQVRGRTRLSLELESRDIDFDNPTSVKDTKETVAYAGIEFGEGGTLIGDLRVGVADLEPRQPDRQGLNEVVGDLQLRYWLTGNTQLQLTGERRTGFTASGQDSYFIDANLGLRGIHYLTRSFGVEAGGSLGTLTFPGSSSQSDREDDLTNYDVGIRLRFSENSMGRRTIYSFNLAKFRRESTDPGRARTRTAVTFGATLGF